MVVQITLLAGSAFSNSHWPQFSRLAAEQISVAAEAYLCLPFLPWALEGRVAQAGPVAQQGPSHLGGEKDAK